MFTVPVKIAASDIDGKGVFCQADIAKGTTVWVFKEDYDGKFSAKERAAWPSVIKVYIERSGFLSLQTGHFIVPPQEDPALYFNHSKQANLAARFDKKVSPEVFFVANRTIKAGEELTNNYREFDGIIQADPPAWV